MFNTSIKGGPVWALVKSTRQFDRALQSVQAVVENQRINQILTHGNRVLLWLCLNTEAKAHIDKPSELENFICTVADLIDAYIKKHHPDSYLAVFFKNTKKCAALVESVAKDLKA